MYPNSGFKISDFIFRFIFPGVLIGLSLFAKAQQSLEFDRLERTDGLSQSSVNCMLRDREGFMWFGTQDGLNRYDGKKFRIFQNQPGDAASISNNYIVSLCEDEEGYLWVGTMTGGLNRFDKHTESFQVFEHSDSLNSISENTVWTVISDNQGNIWSGTSRGLNCFRKSSGKFSWFRSNSSDKQSLITDMVVSLFKDHTGRLWVGTVEGLCLLNGSGGKFSRFLNPEQNHMPGANLVWSISETPDGRILTGTNNGVYSLDPLTGKFTLILGKPGKQAVVAWSMATQQNGTIWVGSNHGLYRITSSAKKPEVFLNDPSRPQSITDNNIWCLMPDPSGFLWVGTNNGISKAKTGPSVFHLFNADSRRFPALSSPKVTAILEDKYGYLWVGTDGGGLNCINPGRTKNTIYRKSATGLQNDNVWALAEDPDGNIWIGNYQGGLHVLKRSSGIIKAFPNNPDDPHALANNRVLALLAANDGIIWIGTRGGGLIRFDPFTEKFKSFLHSHNDSSSISGNTVLSLATDAKNRLWVGTFDGGLDLFIPSTGKFKSFRKTDGQPASISDNNIWAILFDKKGRLWLGTQGGLNFCTNPGETMIFRYFSTRDGLKSNLIFGLAEDKQGNIWMSNFNGLTRLDTRILESENESQRDSRDLSALRSFFRTFDSGHGLQGPEFNQGAYHKGHSGLLYFGGPNGLNYFSSDDVKESRYRPPVVISGMKIFNKEVFILPSSGNVDPHKTEIIRKGSDYFLPGSISYARELTLSYRESVISFEFASLDFTNPSKNQYAYKMINFDPDWNYVGIQNTATYTNLDAGEYTFVIRGSNSDGCWNPAETRLKIIIVPPIWKTLWFITLVILAILLVLFMVVRKVFINQRMKARKEKELIELQLKTIKSQIDPHFAFNALNTIASFIYSEEPDVTYDYFTRFALMIRNILEDHDKISRSLADEIDFVKNYLEIQKIRFRDKFDYRITIAENILPVTQVPKMIIQAYAENAIKHGLMHRLKDGMLIINVWKTGYCLHLVVEDNGVGRAKAAELNPDSTHRGLKIMEQIFELYQKLYPENITQTIEDLTDTNGTASGTRVILTLCMNEDDKPNRKFFGLRLKNLRI